MRFTTPPAPMPGLAALTVVLDARAAHEIEAFHYEPEPPAVDVAPSVGSHRGEAGGTRVVVTLENFPPGDPTFTFGVVTAADVVDLGAGRHQVEVPPGLAADQVVTLHVDVAGTAATAPFLHAGPVREGDLVINEVLADPGGADANGDTVASSTQDEFVEIVNVSGRPLDLTDLELHDAAAGSLRHRFPNPTTLPDGGALVVFGGGAPASFAPPHASGHAQVASRGGLSLNNGGDIVELRAPDGTVLFQLDYAGADVVPARSLVSPDDGGPLPTPAIGADYVLHALPADEGPAFSPGRRTDGAVHE